MAADNGGIVGMRHTVHATRRRYQKMGKIVAERKFGEHNAWDTRFPQGVGNEKENLRNGSFSKGNPSATVG